MDEKPSWLGLRDLIWLVVLALVLAAWGWDRGRLATRVEQLRPQPAPPGAPFMSGALQFTMPLAPIIEDEVALPPLSEP